VVRLAQAAEAAKGDFSSKWQTELEEKRGGWLAFSLWGLKKKEQRNKGKRYGKEKALL